MSAVWTTGLARQAELDRRQGVRGRDQGQTVVMTCLSVGIDCIGHHLGEGGVIAVSVAAAAVGVGLELTRGDEVVGVLRPPHPAGVGAVGDYKLDAQGFGHGAAPRAVRRRPTGRAPAKPER